MPQRKQQVAQHVWHKLLEPEATRFIARFRGSKPDADHLEAIRDLAQRMAADPELLLHGPPYPTPAIFAKHYAAAPDLMAGLLAELRKQWQQFHKSKSGRLQLFLARNPSLLYDDAWNRTRSKLQLDFIDKELPDAYKKATGEVVSADDVTKARKALLKRCAAIKSLKPIDHTEAERLLQDFQQWAKQNPKKAHPWKAY